ncbi:hypothetical protein MHYP_G00191480 [Metynnis hypsauchen]
MEAASRRAVSCLLTASNSFLCARSAGLYQLCFGMYTTVTRSFVLSARCTEKPAGSMTSLGISADSQGLHICQYYAGKWGAISTLSQLDQNAGSLASFPASAAFPWSVGPDEWGLFEVPKQWICVQELKVRFSVSDC